MKVENLRSEKTENRARVAATVTWEDCGRPTHDVYFETDAAFADGLSCNPNAFLIGCAIPAMHYGEERVFIDAEICPELRDGLTTAMSWLRHWYYDPDRALVRIEAKASSGFPTPRTPERAGFFFSGGVDSFATLRANRLNFPLEHTWSIKDGVLAYGLELDQIKDYERVWNWLADVPQAVGITLMPVYTNLYLNYRPEDAKDHYSFWTYEFQGAVLAALAHVFAHRLTVVSIAATFDLPNLARWGSHPLLDPNYSSSDLRVRHDGLALSRLEKVKLVADWDVALQRLRVCNSKHDQLNSLNCGQCEKCVRTMLELVALGVLDQTNAFPEQDVSAELILEKADIHDAYVESCFRELMAPLAERGRHDLVRAIERRIDLYHDRLPGLRAKIGRFNRKYLNGSLKKLISYPGRKSRVLL